MTIRERQRWAVVVAVWGGVALCACEGSEVVSPGGGAIASGGAVDPGLGSGAVLASGGAVPTGGTVLPTSGGEGQVGTGGTGTVTTGGNGQPATGAVAASGGTTIPSGSYDYQDETVMLSADLVVPAGQTLRVGPGTTFVAASGVTIRVEGTLVVEGSDGAPVRFTGNGSPRSWPGIVVESGGSVEMSRFEVVDANYGIHAKLGSAYSLDRGEFGNSFKAMVLQANGSLRNSNVHATDGFGFAPVNEVSAEDVNGTLTIINASPTVENTRFDGGSTLVDMIRVGGNSAPTFDHLYITTAHCGIHANGGNNSGIVIRNSIFERMSFGLMLYTSGPTIEDSVFLSNGNDFGFCFGATDANRPTLRNNYYSGSTPLVDASCFQIGVTEAAPATTQNPNAGPQGL